MYKAFFSATVQGIIQSFKPIAFSTRMMVSNLGCASSLSALYKLSRFRPADSAIFAIPIDRAASPMACCQRTGSFSADNHFAGEYCHDFGAMTFSHRLESVEDFIASMRRGEGNVCVIPNKNQKEM